MQPYFHWINEPAEWRRDSDGLTVVTNKHTDFWRHTWYGFERFSGHLYAAEVAGDFTLQAKICADFTTLYDQAGLMMMADEQTWLKAGIEFNDDAPAIGSVLTLTHSDWATGLFPGDPRTFWLRLTRKGDALRLQYSTDGERWPLLRLGYFPPGPVKAGVMCCSPERGGLAVAVLGNHLFPPLGKTLHELDRTLAGRPHLFPILGPRIAGFAGAREIKMTVLIGIGAARAPCPTRGIIDIAAVRTVAAVGASAHRLPVMATVNTMRSTGRKRHQREYTDYEASAH